MKNKKTFESPYFLEPTDIDGTEDRIQAKAKVWGSMEVYDFIVDTTGTVYVYDDTANYHTTCHSMSAKSQNRIRALVVNKQKLRIKDDCIS